MFEYVLNKIKLFGHHGVYKREQSDGQYFYISIKYSVDDKDIKNDNIDEIIDYSNIIDDIKYIFYKKRFNLIENLILHIKKNLKSKYPKINFIIKISKANPKYNIPIDSVDVEHR